METEIKKVKNIVSMPIHREKIIGKSLFWVFTIVIIIMSFVQVYGRATAETNSVIITDIENKINTAFETVFKADLEGADITELIELINTLNTLFQELITATEGKDSEKVISLTQECERISANIVEDASNLRIVASNLTRIQVEKRNIIIRISIVTVIIFSLLLWSRFKKYYIKRALLMRPTVTIDEPE